MDWGKILPTAIGAGATIGGGILQNKAANKQNDLVASQVARKNAAQDQLMRVLGLPSLGSGGGQGMTTPAAQRTAVGPSGLSKGLGIASTGASIAGSVAPSLLTGLGIGASAVPLIGPILGGLAFGASKIGQGRRTADAWVPTQNKFDQSARTPQDVAQYKMDIQSMLGGNSNQRKVGSQALATAKQYYPDLFA